MKTIITVILILGFFNISFAGEKLDQYFTFMGFKLEESKISDVLKKLGNTVIHKKGDASESYTGICYFIPDKNVTIFFESGEMGGGETLLGYKVIQDFETKYPCREITELPKESLQIGDLNIGDNLETAISLLPKNISSRDDSTFSYYDKIPFTKEQIKKLQVEDMAYAFWDQRVTIQIFTRDNKVTGYSVYKVTSW
jgi:hypothetical protein